MVCSDFAVLRKNYTQEQNIQENKEIFMNIFTGLYYPFLTPPQYNEHKVVYGNNSGIIEKIFWP